MLPSNEADRRFSTDPENDTTDYAADTPDWFGGFMEFVGEMLNALPDALAHIRWH